MLDYLYEGRRVKFIKWPNDTWIEFSEKDEAQIVEIYGQMAKVPAVRFKRPDGDYTFVPVSSLAFVTVEGDGK